jgi:hypothetical protein
VIRGISFHRQRGHAALGKTEQGRGRRQRAAEPDDDCIGGDDVVAIDRLHLHEDLGSEHLVAVSYDLGSLVAIGAVREVRGLARARLDDHLDPASVQALVPLAIALLPQLAIFTILLWPSLYDALAGPVGRIRVLHRFQGAQPSLGITIPPSVVQLPHDYDCEPKGSAHDTGTHEEEVRLRAGYQGGLDRT